MWGLTFVVMTKNYLTSLPALDAASTSYLINGSGTCIFTPPPSPCHI